MENLEDVAKMTEKLLREREEAFNEIDLTLEHCADILEKLSAMLNHAAKQIRRKNDRR